MVLTPESYRQSFSGFGPAVRPNGGAAPKPPGIFLDKRYARGALAAWKEIWLKTLCDVTNGSTGSTVSESFDTKGASQLPKYLIGAGEALYGDELPFRWAHRF